jgi:threonine/homoserine/homoserine lactone efflux protein
VALQAWFKWVNERCPEMMETTLLKAVALASGGILSPGSILLTLLMLGSHRGLRKALAYYLGYTGSYLIMGIGTVLLSAPAKNVVGPAEATPSSFGAWFSLFLGALLLFLAFRTWRNKQHSPRPPRFFQKIDKLPASRLFGLGIFVAFVNMKNLSIFIAAIAIIVDARLPPSEGVLISVIATLVFSLAVLGPILLFAAGRARAQPVLESLRKTLETRSRRVTLTVLTLFGTLMLARGIHTLLLIS